MTSRERKFKIGFDSCMASGLDETKLLKEEVTFGIITYGLGAVM